MVERLGGAVRQETDAAAGRAGDSWREYTRDDIERGAKRAHRRPGSLGGHATNLGTGPKVKKGKKMAGRMGGEQVTVRSLDVIHADPEKNLLVVKGPVPGPNGCDLYVKPAVRLYKSKAHKQAAG